MSLRALVTSPQKSAPRRLRRRQDPAGRVIGRSKLDPKTLCVTPPSLANERLAWLEVLAVVARVVHAVGGVEEAGLGATEASFIEAEALTRAPAQVLALGKQLQLNRLLGRTRTSTHDLGAQ